MVFCNQAILVAAVGECKCSYLVNRKNRGIFLMRQTKAQKEISKYQRLAKRTQKQTWADVEKLSEIVNSSKPGDDFYRQAMDAITCLRLFKCKTQQNARLWKAADDVVQRLLQIACKHKAYRTAKENFGGGGAITPPYDK